MVGKQGELVRDRFSRGRGQRDWIQVIHEGVLFGRG